MILYYEIFLIKYNNVKKIIKFIKLLLYYICLTYHNLKNSYLNIYEKLRKNFIIYFI